MSLIRTYDTLTPGLNALAGVMRNKRALLAAVGGELKNALTDHWRARGGVFWAGIVKATVGPNIDGNAAEVVVGNPEGPKLAHKITGGVVRAKPPRKYLAIPASPEAKRLGWPSHWSKRGDGQLEPVFGSGGRLVALAFVGVRSKALRKKIGIGKGAKPIWRGKVAYWLKESVTHRPDANALPQDAAIMARVLDAGRQAVEREALRAGVR